MVVALLVEKSPASDWRDHLPRDRDYQPERGRLRRWFDIKMPSVVRVVERRGGLIRGFQGVTVYIVCQLCGLSRGFFCLFSEVKQLVCYLDLQPPDEIRYQLLVVLHPANVTD